MQSYTTLDGRVLDLSDITEAGRAFFDRCAELYHEGSGWMTISGLVSSTENPLLRPTGGMITPAVHEHPLFRALEDLGYRAGIREGKVQAGPADDPGLDPFTDEWITTSAALERKGVVRSGLLAAVKRGAVIARPAKVGGSHLVVSVRSLERWQPMEGRQKAGRASRERAATVA